RGGLYIQENSINDNAIWIRTQGDANRALRVDDWASAIGQYALFADNAGVVSSKSELSIDSDGDVGIGTTAPNVSGYSGTVLTVGKGEATLVSAVEIYGHRTGTDGSIGAELTFLNISAPGSGPDKRIAMIRGLRSGDDNSGGLAFYTRNGASWSTLTILHDGKVGIGTTLPGTYKLAVIGEICETTAGTSACASDIRLKENITVIDDAVGILMKLNPVEFIWKDSGEKSIGLIAQDIEEVYPEWIRDAGNGYITYNNPGFTFYLIKAIQEQQLEIEPAPISVSSFIVPSSAFNNVP
ncbi:unnamed protein product, partial [marine sediment metagenome]